jgi:hypothetical protein
METNIEGLNTLFKLMLTIWRKSIIQIHLWENIGIIQINRNYKKLMAKLY